MDKLDQWQYDEIVKCIASQYSMTQEEAVNKVEEYDLKRLFLLDPLYVHHYAPSDWANMIMEALGYGKRN